MYKAHAFVALFALVFSLSANTASAHVDPTLLNHHHYVNSSHQVIHSPSYTTKNVVPAGASARCRDKSYSFSAHRRGTCSGHGGVSTWF